ncbi:MAG: flagellar hook-length control protein FliK [Castellaniella sp.]|uniref:flagellar hook-length control protein FliK n=1 Tax=Castellaniella sp. TaxID=1955812 RepID=UPI0012182E3E|nr:flagellar hook-length control protein FliK [Castellaniella sp.]TAN27735.1 MAG: flagellar hook-length control protein FliK [Castellaniella sp.]
MSIGAPSNLGTLLVQRLDAALGTTLGQQASTINGAGPLAIPQPGNPENPNALQNPTQRDTREAVDQAATQGQQRAAVGKATRDMQLDNLLGRATTLHSVTQSAPTTLGYAARIILALLNAYPEADPTIRAQTPLLPGAPQTAPTDGTSGPATNATAAGSPSAANPTQIGGTSPTSGQLATTLNQPGALAARLTEALTQSVQSSGLFYESHLAQLAAGQSSPQALRQEPQGRIPSTQSSPTTLPSDQGINPHQVPANLTASLSAETTATFPGGDSTRQAASTSTGPAAAHGSVPGIDPQVQGLVRQQLDVLANQSFVWQGEAWPGAAMRWEIQRREADDSGPRDFEDRHWATRLRLSLPSLGDVQARMSLSGDHLVMRLTAPQSAQRLGNAIETLRTRLLAKGLQASQLAVASHEETPDAAAPQTHAIGPT